MIKDLLLALAALVTIGLGVHGVRVWKRDLVGKEVYTAARELVKQTHVACSAVRKLRAPVTPLERKTFTKEDFEVMTANERWRISEIEVYQKRIVDYALKIEKFESAKLDLRVLIGSKAYEGFLPFGKLLTEVVYLVNDYLDILRDFSKCAHPESANVVEAQRSLYSSSNLDDDFSQALAICREDGEHSILSYLHRKSIYG